MIQELFHLFIIIISLACDVVVCALKLKKCWLFIRFNSIQHKQFLVYHDLATSSFIFLSLSVMVFDLYNLENFSIGNDKQPVKGWSPYHRIQLRQGLCMMFVCVLIKRCEDKQRQTDINKGTLDEIKQSITVLYCRFCLQLTPPKV